MKGSLDLLFDVKSLVNKEKDKILASTRTGRHALLFKRSAGFLNGLWGEFEKYN